MRLFIALTFDDAFKDGAERVQASLKNVCADGNLTRRENLHLTLVFLGECDEDRLSDIKAAMEQAAGECFTIASGKAGAFGHGGVRWLGVEKNPALEALTARLCRELQIRGFELENRVFVPHITLGRNMIMSDHFDETALAGEKFSQPICAFTLMESRQTNGTVEYKPIFSVKLR